jgi:GPH family glycoside/pentoside/hexuronide:cation symporter
MARRAARFFPLLAYTAPAFLSAFVHLPAAGVLPTIYSTEFGLSLTLIGTALLISRSADVVLDPLIGWLSDRTGGRLGPRKPWIMIGVVLTAVASWFLFLPPAHPSFSYFLLWYTVIYLAWSLIEIPHVAWGFEITRDYDGRSRIVALRLVAQAIAGISFLLLPLLPIFKNTAVTSATMRSVGLSVLVLCLPVLLATLVAPAGIKVERRDHYRLRDLLSMVRGNRPFWIFLCGFVLNGFSAGMFGALIFLYFSNYLALANQFVLLFAAQTLVTLVSLPLAPRVIKRLGKRETWAGSMVIGMCVFPLILAVPKGPAGLIPLLLLCIPTGFTNALTTVASGSVLGDVIDYDTWRTGKKRAAVYSAVIAFVVKLNAIPGGAVALMIVGLFGYRTELGPANPPFAALGLKIAFVFAPMVFFGLSALFAWRFPIDRRRQELIARRLASREARERVALQASDVVAAQADRLGAAPQSISR